MYWEQSSISYFWQFIFEFRNKIVWNKGISFGLFSESYYNILIYCCILIGIFLVIYAWKKSKNKADAFAWGLIVGGGLSNLWDRWFFGAVLDFISISFKRIQFPIFNIADIAITLGVIMLMRDILFRKKGAKKSKE
jgi:signal peptidase II